MTLSTAELPRASAVAARLEVLERTGSTNADLVAGIGADAAQWPHLAVVVTDDQTAGRGRLGRSWTAPPGASLAISVALDVSALPPTAIGWIPLLAGVAMADAVAAQLEGHGVRVKWPNDVLVDGLKICGILAEAVPDVGVVVLGAGVNTAMVQADLPVPTAVSFAAIGRDADVDRLLADYLTGVRDLFAALVAAGGDAEAAGVRAAVADHCATLGSRVRVSLPGGGILDGVAERLGAGGELIVRTADGETAVSAGDVVHVR